MSVNRIVDIFGTVLARYIALIGHVLAGNATLRRALVGTESVKKWFAEKGSPGPLNWGVRLNSAWMIQG